MKRLTRKTSLKGVLPVPGDKSISHRALILGGVAEGRTVIRGLSPGKDCLSTISCLGKMGVRIEQDKDQTVVFGKGLSGLEDPGEILDAGNSGTTLRLLSGILAGQDFSCLIGGDASLNSRPMERIILPLSRMGAEIESTAGNGCPPLKISGHPLKGIQYRSPVPSAQVKSCILLAGLYADGRTSVIEPAASRDHTERMLPLFGVDLDREGNTLTLEAGQKLTSAQISIPGDLSAAAFFLAAGLITPDSSLRLKNVGVNRTRAGIIRVCRQMGADIILENRHTVCGEPVADLLVRSSVLHGTVVKGETIPSLIDELPLVCLLACFAEGETLIRDARELKVKESDRIALVSSNLQRMGADITPLEDGFLIRGGFPLHGAVIDCKGDHRIAMTFAVAGINAEGTTIIPESECASTSDPAFFSRLESLF